MEEEVLDYALFIWKDEAFEHLEMLQCLMKDPDQISVRGFLSWMLKISSMVEKVNVNLNDDPIEDFFKELEEGSGG